MVKQMFDKFIHTVSFRFIVAFIVSLVLSDYVVTALFEGENCAVPLTSENGRCVEIDHCQYAKNLIFKRINPGICGFKKNIPLVCCPISQKLQAQKPGVLSKEKCDKYYYRDKLARGVAQGQKALPKEFPHMAAVGYGENKTNIVWLCGGSLISHFFVLSAAHCAYSRDFGPAAWIRLGDLDLKNTTDDANPQDVKISQIYVHPKYNLSSYYHDIALFKMEERVSFGIYFKPACLHVIRSIPVNTLQVTGWGQVEYFGESSSHLMKANLSLIDHDTCARRYANVNKTRKLKNGILDDFQICAGDEQGTDTCPGDSGGPLHFPVEGTIESNYHFVVVGVTSFGKGCGGENTCGVYTRVSAYVGWIENIVWKETDDDEIINLYLDTLT